MTEETNSVERNAATDVLSIEEVMAKVRVLVTTLLDGGAKLPDISFGLAYVATEFGLAVAEESAQVFPVVLNAVTSATTNHKSRTEETETNNPDASNSQDRKPNGATLH